MQTKEIDRDKLRRLAELRTDGAKVLSVYLNLDPTEFASAAARSTEIRSLLDAAHKKIKNGGGFSHDQQTALRADLERIEEFFKDDFSAKGAHGLALFCSGPADLFEVIKLPRPVDSDVAIGDSPYVEPLAELAGDGSWCVVLVSRRMGRVLRGSRESLQEVARISDDVHRWHDQGGWSQARYQRGIEKETHDHVKNTLDVVFRGFRRNPFDGLLIGAPEPLDREVEDKLHPYVKERLVGRIEVDVENTNEEEVLAAAAPVIEREDTRREREALDRIAEGSAKAGGRAAAGLDAVLETLNERRVETLVVEPNFESHGVRCPECGWLGPSGDTCPADGTTLEEREDIMEDAVQLAIAQSAGVLRVRHHIDEIADRGGIAAVLRFSRRMRKEKAPAVAGAFGVGLTPAARSDSYMRLELPKRSPKP
jgi:peptide subunit release factor 1 (eRF1)